MATVLLINEKDKFKEIAIRQLWCIYKHCILFIVRNCLNCTSYGQKPIRKIQNA